MFRVIKVQNQKGFTFMELTVVMLLVSIISVAGYMLFMVGESAWSTTSSNIHMQDNIRRLLQRVSIELQESGTDSGGILQITIDDNTGVNGSDVLRFAIPLCLCGVSPIDSNGDVQYWGAPLAWGQSGCTNNYPVENNNKVIICHLPPGNPGNTQTIQVSVNSVKAHLAHGDRIGDCNSCSLVSYTNRFIEYRIDANNRLVRRVLDSSLAIVNEFVVADSLEDFQVSLNTDQTIVTLSVDLTRNSSRNRILAMTDSVDVILRN